MCFTIDHRSIVWNYQRSCAAHHPKVEKTNEKRKLLNIFFFRSENCHRIPFGSPAGNWSNVFNCNIFPSTLFCEAKKKISHLNLNRQIDLTRTFMSFSHGTCCIYSHNSGSDSYPQCSVTLFLLWLSTRCKAQSYRLTKSFGLPLVFTNFRFYLFQPNLMPYSSIGHFRVEFCMRINIRRGKNG